MYTSLLEYIRCGDTAIAGAVDVKQKVKELSMLDNTINKTGFQLQFEVYKVLMLTVDHVCFN